MPLAKDWFLFAAKLTNLRDLSNSSLQLNVKSVRNIFAFCQASSIGESFGNINVYIYLYLITYQNNCGYWCCCWWCGYLLCFLLLIFVMGVVAVGGGVLFIRILSLGIVIILLVSMTDQPGLRNICKV